MSSVFCLKQESLSWQDRTINVEFMVAPARSQLLFNKHKGLKTKLEQESYYLEREKESFLKSHKTEQRFMERRKELYSKIRNDIILRRASAEGRRRACITGRISAPPRLEEDHKSDSKAFITEIPLRETKSAGARTGFHKPATPCKRLSEPEVKGILPPPTPDMRATSPSVSIRSPTPGKPYLLREKTVRFEQINLDSGKEQEPQLPVQDRIKNFLSTQAEFNKRGPEKVTAKCREEFENNTRRLLARRRSSYNLNIAKLENAFDEFCVDGSTDGLSKLTKYASRMKASVKNARPPSMMFESQAVCMVES